jgi:hypothetical protein
MAGFWTAVLVCGTEQPAQLRLRVRLYNLAVTPGFDVSAAQNEATQILDNAGIAVEWEEGDPTADAAYELDASAQSSDGGIWRSGEISMRILPRAPKALASGALGMALPFATRGVHVTLFADRIGDAARTTSLKRGQLLGAAFAHEVGHMLLQTSAHSVAGIMRACWTYSEYVQIAMGKLRFSPSEKQRMRRTLLRRMAELK